MMEDALSAKMHEFMTALDQVKKYRAIVSSLTDFAIIMATTAVTILFIFMSIIFGSVFIEYTTTLVGLFFLAFIILLFGTAFGIYWVGRRVWYVKVGEWQNTLSEGTPGAIKLLQEINWENVFSDIRLAKLGSAVYGISRIFIYWVVATVAFSFLNPMFEHIFHVSISFIVVALFSLVLVLILNRKSLRKRFDQIGRLDGLLWELRWFDSEFRRADFKT
jgi:hypothetical protein